MKPKAKIQTRPLKALLGLGLAFTTNLCLATDPIVANFDNSESIAGWANNGGNGTVEWSANQGVGASGAVKVTLDASLGSEVDPAWTLGANSFNSALYWSVSFDIKIEATSGTDDAGSYGHLQVVPRNAAGSWGSLNYTLADSSFNTWKHMEFGFVRPYDAIAMLQFQLQGAGLYTGNVVFYLDNVTIVPLPNAVVFNAFTNTSEVSGFNSWGANGSGAGTSLSWVASPDAGGPKPAGAMKLYADYATGVSGWQEGTSQRNISFDPSRFTYFDFDVYLDPASTAPYGMVQLFLTQNHSPYNWLWAGNYSFAAADAGQWKHLSFPMAPTLETNAGGFVLQAGGNGLGGPVTLYYDNLKIWTPLTPPTLGKLEKGTPGGAKLTMDLPGAANQWQRDAIVTANNESYGWYNSGAMSYAFTVADFPEASAHPGFEAHIFLVNADTLASPGDAMYGGVDWNAPDIMVARLENNANGSVDFSLRFKTNSPGANANNTVVTANGTTATGTWTVAFTDNTSGTLSGPGGVSVPFTLPQEVADRFYGTMVLHFGAFKNDGAASGINDFASATFSRIQVTGGTLPIDERFDGPGLTANYAWRTTSSSAIAWVPSGTALFLSWSLPDDGFVLESAPAITGPWSNAGVVSTSVKGASREAAIPSTGVPAGNSAFFRLTKTVTP